MPLSNVLKRGFLVLGFSLMVAKTGVCAPAIVTDVDQTNQMYQMNQYHVEQIDILNTIKEEITAIKEAIGTKGSSASSQYFTSDVSGLQAGGSGGYSDYASSSSVIKASSNDVDALANEIIDALTSIDRKNESIDETKKRIENKRKYVSEVVVQGLATAVNIRDSVSETNLVIEQMASLTEKSSATVIDDIGVNNRILVEVLKYVAQLGVSTAINAELVAVDQLNRDDTL